MVRKEQKVLTMLLVRMDDSKGEKEQKVLVKPKDLSAIISKQGKGKLSPTISQNGR